MRQQGLHHLDSLGLGYAFLQHNGRILLDGLSVLHHLGDESRLHHLAVVGYGIVEGQRIDGRYLCLVAYRHPGQRRLAPVFRAVGSLRVYLTNVRCSVAHKRQLQVFADAYAVESFDIFLRMAAIELVDDVAGADVGTHLQGTGHADGAIAATSPVMVFHRPAMHLHDATAGRNLETRVVRNDAVIQSHEEGCHLEHRTRLTTVADGRVDSFGILSVTHASHIDNGLHVARLNLHQDGHAQVGIHFGQLHLLNQGTLGQVLHVHVDGCHDVSTVNRWNLRDVHHLVEHLLAVLHTIVTTQQRVERQFYAATGRVNLAEHDAHRALCQ